MNREEAQKQAEDLPYMKLLAIMMWKEGIDEFVIDTDKLAKMPQDYAVVTGPHPNDKTIRIRLMKEVDAELERDKL